MPRPNPHQHPRRPRTSGALHGRRARPINVSPDPLDPDEYGAEDLKAQGETTVGPLNSRSRAMVVHRIAAALAFSGLRHQDQALIHEVCRSEPYCQHKDISRRLSSLRDIEVPLNMYFGRHTLRADWTVEFALSVQGGVEFDLVWRLADGRIVVDELKVERMELERKLQLRTQTERQLRAAAALWSPAFAGIRECVLSQRYASYWVTPDGRRRPWSEAPS